MSERAFFAPRLSSRRAAVDVITNPWMSANTTPIVLATYEFQLRRNIQDDCNDNFKISMLTAPRPSCNTLFFSVVLSVAEGAAEAVIDRDTYRTRSQ